MTKTGQANRPGTPQVRVADNPLRAPFTPPIPTSGLEPTSQCEGLTVALAWIGRSPVNDRYDLPNVSFNGELEVGLV